jgi:heterodisulfide reductase subunit A
LLLTPFCYSQQFNDSCISFIYQLFDILLFTLLNEECRMAEKVVGSVMVVGGGIAGMQSALDLANSGYYVYLVEKSAAIGGLMSQLDKTFPTNDCAM